jgi:divalent metal cation (Fe/Co/Zn/Cd) transporter
MTVEGVVGLIAGLEASALSVIVWAASSFVEGLASIIVIWRFTGSRTLSEHSEHVAQRLVAGSFLLLVPFFVYEAIRRLIVGSDATSSTLGIAVTASAVVLMPLLGYAKLKLGQRLGSGATAGEGIQNLMCAAQAAAALIALIGASAGLGLIDPIAALVVAAIAAVESVALWRGEQDDCCAPIGFANLPADDCCSANCDCCC